MKDTNQYIEPKQPSLISKIFKKTKNEYKVKKDFYEYIKFKGEVENRLKINKIVIENVNNIEKLFLNYFLSLRKLNLDKNVDELFKLTQDFNFETLRLNKRKQLGVNLIEIIEEQYNILNKEYNFIIRLRNKYYLNKKTDILTYFHASQSYHMTVLSRAKSKFEYNILKA